VLAAPIHALAEPCPKKPDDRRRRVGTSGRARRWQWLGLGLAYLVLVLATTLAFLVLR